MGRRLKTPYTPSVLEYRYAQVAPKTNNFKFDYEQEKIIKIDNAEMMLADPTWNQHNYFHLK